MMHFTLGRHAAIGVALACALASCHAPVSTAAKPATAPTAATNWSLLTPNRHVQAFGGFGGSALPAATALPPATGLTYQPGGLLPFVASGFGTNNGVFLADPANNTIYQAPALGSNISVVGPNADGRLVAISDAGQLGLYDLPSQTIQVFPQLENSTPVVSAATDAFGTLAYTSTDGRVHLFDPYTGQDYIAPAAGLGLTDVNNLSLSADGRFLTYSAVGSAGPNIFTADLATGSQLSDGLLNGLPGVLIPLQISPDGAAMLFTQNGQLRLLDRSTGFVDNLALVNTGSPVTDATFLGNGSLIEFMRDGQFLIYDRATHVIDTMPVVNQLSGLSLFGDGSRFNLGF